MAPCRASPFTNGASALPMTCWYAWFSMTTTTTCAGCGTLATGAVPAAGGDGLALAGGAPEPDNAPCGGGVDAQPAMAKASIAADAAAKGNPLMRPVWRAC